MIRADPDPQHRKKTSTLSIPPAFIFMMSTKLYNMSLGVLKPILIPLKAR